jgi:hypothetical protein
VGRRVLQRRRKMADQSTKNSFKPLLGKFDIGNDRWVVQEWEWDLGSRDIFEASLRFVVNLDKTWHRRGIGEVSERGYRLNSIIGWRDESGVWGVPVEVELELGGREVQ